MEQPVLIVALVGAVIFVGSLLLPKRTSKDAQGKTTQNMEIALEQFMDNMEADHRELVQLVSEARQEQLAQAAAKEERIAELERRCTEQEKLAALLAQQLEALQLRPSATTAELNTRDEAAELRPSIKSRYADLFALHDNGKSLEAIAKKLGLNKGEVQLILQLAKQEDAR